MVTKTTVNHQPDWAKPRISYMSPEALVIVDGLEHSVSWDELVKYIRERELIANDETVRSLWERYQVAVKLVGSKDHG